MKKKLQEKIKDKGVGVMFGIAIGTSLNFVSNLSNFIFLKDRHKQYKEELKDVKIYEDMVSDEEISEFRKKNKKDYEYMSDNEIKQNLGALKLKNKKRQKKIVEGTMTKDRYKKD